MEKIIKISLTLGILCLPNLSFILDDYTAAFFENYLDLNVLQSIGFFVSSLLPDKWLTKCIKHVKKTIRHIKPQIKTRRIRRIRRGVKKNFKFMKVTEKNVETDDENNEKEINIVCPERKEEIKM